MPEKFDCEKYYNEMLPEIHPLSSYYSNAAFKGELKRFTIISKLIKAEIGDGMSRKLVDLGCGSGLLLLIAKAFKMELYGLDISSSILNELEKLIEERNVRCKLLKSDIRKTPFLNSEFDIAICSEVLEHIENPEDAIKEMSRIIKKNGIAIITVPFEEDIQSTICTHCYKRTPLYGHLHSFNGDSIGVMLERNGFRTERVETMHSVLPIAFYDRLPYGIWSRADYILQKLIGRKPSWLIFKTRKVE